MPTRPDRRRLAGDAGTGLIASAAALLVVLAFLLFAVQLLVGLHTASVVGALADEGALRVASAGVDHTDPTSIAAARRDAEAHLRTLLGAQAEVTTFDWSGSTNVEVVLRIRTESPRFMLGGVQGSLVTDHVERTARVPVEVVR